MNFIMELDDCGPSRRILANCVAFALFYSFTWFALTVLDLQGPAQGLVVALGLELKNSFLVVDGGCGESWVDPFQLQVLPGVALFLGLES